MSAAPAPFTKATTGEWIYCVSTVAKFPLHPHLIQDPHN